MTVASNEAPDTTWAATWQNKQNECAPSEVSDQPGHPPSLIRVFAVCSLVSWGSKVSSCGQRRLWSDWADAQADLSLRWTHSHFVSFVMSRLTFSDINFHVLQVSKHNFCYTKKLLKNTYITAESFQSAIKHIEFSYILSNVLTGHLVFIIFLQSQKQSHNSVCIPRWTNMSVKHTN